MAPDGGQTGEEVSTIITCEGTLGHPEFPRQFKKVVDRLNGLLGVPVKVRKLEPWNSVRVTLSVPREAALRLRQLAQQGAPQLRALGILSVQLDGEGAISLRLQGANGEPQEVILRTTQDGSSSSSSSVPRNLGALLPTASGTSGSSASSSQVQFKSPNVVCPPDSVVPRVDTTMGPPQSTVSANSINKPPYAGPFPFASMNQAIHSQSSAANGPSSGSRTTNMEPPPPPVLPPPYLGMRQASASGVAQASTQPPVTISSPLLVNLLQNDQQVGTNSVANPPNNNSKTSSSGVVRQMRPPPPPVPSAKSTAPPPLPSPSTTVPSPQPQPLKSVSSAASPQGTSERLINSQANVLVNSSNNNLSSSTVSSNSSPTSALPTSLSSNNNNNNNNSSSSLSATHSSAVTSTQLAISNIASSLASAANSLSSSSGSGLTQPGVFGVAKTGPFVQAGTGSTVHHYQRTPQGSIIAVNKPNQPAGASSLSSIPLHPAQRTNLPLGQAQSAQAILRQQQIAATIPSTKNQQLFGPNNVTSHQNSLVSQHSPKVLSGNGMLPSNNNATVPGSNAALSGSSHSLPHGNMGSLGGNVMSRGGQSLAGLGNGIVGQQLQNNVGLGLGQADALGPQVASAEAAVTNVIKKPLPSPPPYSVAITRNWESLMGSAPNLLDLAPALTDLKPDELDELLPTLDQDALPELAELELLGSALSANSDVATGLCEDNASNGIGSNGIAREDVVAASRGSTVENSTNSLHSDGRKFLINPLTGELELQSGGEESEAEDVKDVFTGLPSPLGLSDEDTSSTTRPDTTTDQSDSETRSSTEGKHSRNKNSKGRREGRDSPAQKPEKIKLRLKLEKNEPINPAYKVDVSFINTQQPKKASTSVIGAASLPPSGGIEELRVPPLHISLRGRNSVVIKNKTKQNPDGTPMVKKARKLQSKGKKEGGVDQEAGDLGEHKRAKKFKPNHEHKDLLATLSDLPPSPTNNTISKYSLHNHYKDKQKERRGSDSELVRANIKKHDANGAFASEEKRRRLSQSESDKRLDDSEPIPSVLGSTNVGTVGVLPQKIRKEKVKVKESFKLKDGSRKFFATSKAALGLNVPPSPPDKRQQQSTAVTLPTAVDMDMEAKFKQSLMEGVIGEKGISRPPHRTVEMVGHVQIDAARVGSVGDKVHNSPPETIPVSDIVVKEKSPEPEKCNLPESERKSLDSLQDREKQLNNVVTSGGRSPNSGSSGGQGEDSGIESMDALSEKSPNQASQSPHADILPNVVVVPTSKTQVPDIHMLDIEAQLAKMEGLEPHQEELSSVDVRQKSNNSALQSPPATDLDSASKADRRSPNRTTEDVNENECIHRSDSKPCCDLTCTLQDDLEKDEEKCSTDTGKEEAAPVKSSKPDGQQPPTSPTLRVAPALYSYPSEPVDKGGTMGESRGDSESPTLTTEDEDSNMSTSVAHSQQQHQVNNKNKSLLEQLLIEIPNSEAHGTSLHSPATRSSVRTRALSKLNSPELNSPAPKLAKAALPTAKRKRNASDSSNHSVEEMRKRPRKGSEASELGKRAQHPISALKKVPKGTTTQNPQQHEESSDSDEPLIEKLRKNAPKSSNVKTTKAVPQTTPASQVNNKTNIRRSARAGHQQDKQEKQQQQQPAQNTRSREKVVQQLSHQPQAPQQQQAAHGNAEAEAALRRKTRSADMESKRKKEVK